MKLRNFALSRSHWLSRLCRGYPSLAEAGDGHPTDRRRQAVSGAGRGTAQQQRHQSRVHEAGLAQARGGQAQHRPGGRFLEPDRTAGREVRLQRAGRRDPGCAEPQPASRASMVRKLEERSLQLPARLGEEGLTSASRASRCRLGKTIELLSTLSDANRDADARAFAALMRHVKEVDGQQHTVLMIQVENEVNVEGDSRDRSPAANKAFAGPVPKELMDYLQKHKETLISEFRQVWETAGFKTSGTWEEVFGKGVATDQALHGLELCALRRPGGRGGQSRIPDTDVRERGGDAHLREYSRSTAHIAAALWLS